MSTEKQKMLAGQLYNPLDPELQADRRRARLLVKRFNDSGDDEGGLRKSLLQELFGQADRVPFIEPPFFCDYGYNISTGEGVFFNFNCVVLDVMPVIIGAYTLFGPGVQLLTATHPLNWRVRRDLLEAAKPITIGADAWLGGGVIVCPGVTIGDRTVIGAGSVVTRDIPADVFAAGNPCRVIKGIAEENGS